MFAHRQYHQRKEEEDNFDFIIPFLVNSSLGKQSTKIFSISSKRNFPSPQKRSPHRQQIQQLSKIYTMKHQSSHRKKSRLKAPLQPDTSPLSLEKNNGIGANASPKHHLPPSKSTKLHRFLRTKSHANQPYQDQEYFQNKLSQRHSVEKNKRDASPILGIKFKTQKQVKDPKEESNEKGLEGDRPGNELQWEQFRGDIKRKVKYARERKLWQKTKGLNVDSIVNRNCSNFQELVQEYSRRMQLSPGSKIYIFDSKDLWMKRVLQERGWVENSNRVSKAFHLLWSNKVSKDQVGPQQLCNHYPNSYSITTKAGLHNSLKKYGYEHLQPPTYDLSHQKDAFLKYYSEIQFFGLLAGFLQKFAFEDPEFVLSSEEVLSSIDKLMEKSKENPQLGSRREQLIANMLRQCKLILEDQFEVSDTDCFVDLYGLIKSQPLNEVQEEGIRLLRDFYNFSQSQSQFPRSKTSGHLNWWLTKSKISSKGVGITLHHELDTILKYNNRLVQKYIEKPLLFDNKPFRGRKFDLRIWVLVVGSAPETYYHEQFYGRLASEPYSLQPQHYCNNNIHLTNFTLNKQHFSKSMQLDQSIIFPQDLFAAIRNEFSFEYQAKFHSDVHRMLCKIGQVLGKELGGKSGKNCFQLLGVDVILDCSLHMHLLEVNLSASCQERHPGLTSMLEEMGHGLLNILEGRGGELRGWRPIQ